MVLFIAVSLLFGWQEGIQPVKTGGCPSEQMDEGNHGANGFKENSCWLVYVCVW